MKSKSIAHVKQHHRILELDALRGIAAMAIMAYHYFFRYNEIYAHPYTKVAWTNCGKYFVYLFFIISGFVIFWSLNNLKKPFDFMVSRFSRLYPAYWTALVITFSMVCLFGLPGRKISIQNGLLNLLMFHEALGVPHIDGVYWTLTIELIFYWWSFILYLFNQLKNIELWICPLIILSIFQGIEIINMPNELTKILLINHIYFFGAGICFYKILNKEANKLTILILFTTLFSTIPSFSIKHFLIFSSFYIFFYLSINGYFKFLKNPVFIFMGSLSYPLYLIHQNIGYIIINQSYNFDYPLVYGICSAITLSILIAYCINKYIEKPSSFLIRVYYRQNEKIQTIVKKLPHKNL